MLREGSLNTHEPNGVAPSYLSHNTFHRCFISFVSNSVLLIDLFHCGCRATFTSVMYLYLSSSEEFHMQKSWKVWEAERLERVAGEKMRIKRLQLDYLLQRMPY